MINKLKIFRVIADLKQQELAEKVEVSRQTIIAIEAGKYIPSTLLSLKLAAVLNTSVEVLFNLEESDWKREK
ncbi:MAG: helix-turn-helix transcriptional regulator [Bacteroidales bacterium]|nr:helix-turn-helix transcriptional regulator [Bacteroidales bacterium]